MEWFQMKHMMSLGSEDSSRFAAALLWRNGALRKTFREFVLPKFMHRSQKLHSVSLRDFFQPGAVENEPVRTSKHSVFRPARRWLAPLLRRNH